MSTTNGNTDKLKELLRSLMYLLISIILDKIFRRKDETKTD